MTLRELIEVQTKDLSLIKVHVGAEDKVRGDGMIIIHDGTLADVPERMKDRKIMSVSNYSDGTPHYIDIY